MAFKYIRVTTGDMIWGKHELSRQYFVSAVQSGDALINLEDMTYFSKDDNEWKPIDGDQPKD